MTSLPGQPSKFVDIGGGMGVRVPSQDLGLAMTLIGPGGDIWELAQDPGLIPGVTVKRDQDFIFTVDGHADPCPIIDKVTLTSGDGIACKDCKAKLEGSKGLVVLNFHGLMLVAHCLLCGSFNWVQLGPKREGESWGDFKERTNDLVPGGWDAFIQVMKEKLNVK